MADVIPAGTSSLVTLAINSSSTGAIDFFGDSDWLRVSLTAGYGYLFDLKGLSSGNGTLGDPCYPRNMPAAYEVS